LRENWADIPSFADVCGMLRAGHGLVLIVITLLVFGVVMVTSAGLSVNSSHTVNLQEVLLGRTTVLAALAIASMLVGSLVPLRWFEPASAPGNQVAPRPRFISPISCIMIVAILLLVAVHVPHIGREVNGARRWINLGPIGFQPSEIAKWGMVLAMAAYGAQQARNMHSFWRGFFTPMMLVLVVCGLIAKEDLGTAVLIGVVSVAMLVAAGARIWHAAMLMPIGALLIVAAVVASPYRVGRVHAFLDPYAAPRGIGYHILQSMGAIHGGGLPGRGLGNSIQKFGYLPEATTDFIFAVICEELGVMGAAVVVSLYAFLLLCAFSIVRRIESPFQRLVGLGILLVVGLQAFINIAVVTGSAPTKGIALPLLSSGGTGWVLTAFCIGLLISMDRQLARSDQLAAEFQASVDDTAASGSLVPATA
jgi:cell division protein FtsW